MVNQSYLFTRRGFSQGQISCGVYTFIRFAIGLFLFCLFCFCFSIARKGLFPQTMLLLSLYAANIRNSLVSIYLLRQSCVTRAMINPQVLKKDMSDNADNGLFSPF